MSEPELSEVLAELRELRAEVTTLRAQVAQQTPPEPVTPPLPLASNGHEKIDGDGTDAVSRRHALRTAGMVAAGTLAGGAALVTAAGTAAAASGNFDGNPAVTATGSPAYRGFTTAVGAICADLQANYADSTVLNATAYGANSIGIEAQGTALGIRGRSSGGQAIIGDASSSGTIGVYGLGSNSAIGVQGSSPYIGVYGSTTSAAGEGVRGESTSGAAVHGISYSTGRGGQFESASGIGVEGNGQRGVRAIGTYAALQMTPTSFPPPSASIPYYAGELTPGPGDVLWYCVEAGTPGTWRTLAAPNSAGAFYAVTPGRVYDSRLSTYPQHGALGSGQNRTLSVASSYDLNGALLNSNFIPTGATAVFANIVVVDTIGNGWLAINPGGDSVVHAATINWSQTGQVLANGISLTLNDSRQITVINGSAGSTQFIIDITGYWL